MKMRKTLLALSFAMSYSANAQLADYEKTVTFDNPVDFTSMIKNPGFEESIEGWVNEPGFKTFERVTWRGVMDDVCISGKAYLNLFHDKGAKGRISQTIDNMPNGVYSVRAGLFTNTPGANIFLNDNIVPAEVNSTKFYQVYAIVEDSTVVLGYYSSHEKDFWSCADNFSLTYYGNGDDAHKMYKELMGEASADDIAKTVKQLRADIEAAEQLLDFLGGEYYDALYEEMVKASDLCGDANATLDQLNAAIISLGEAVSKGRQFKQAHDELGIQIDALRQGIEKYRQTSQQQTLADAEELLVLSEDAYYYIDRTSIEQMNDYVARIKRMLELLPLPGFIGSDEIPQDYTHLIVNPGFEDGLNGWINEPAFTECKPTNWATMLDGKFMTGKYYVNLYSAPDTGQAGTLCQTINNLPAGNYYVEAAVFSNRNGLKFFVNSVEVAIPIGPEKPPYGSLYGAYVTLAEGEPLVFGVRTNEAVEFWGGVDNFKLTRYVKDPAGISQMQVEHKPTAIHSLSGVSSVSLRNGLNIVRYSNGTVKKIIKK